MLSLSGSAKRVLSGGFDLSHHIDSLMQQRPSILSKHFIEMLHHEPSSYPLRSKGLALYTEDHGAKPSIHN